MSGKKIRLGLIGAGRIGKLHAENIATRVGSVELTHIADLNREAAKTLAEQHRVPHATDDYRALVKNPAIDAVIICSATNTHSEIIREAAAHGKHVFCEKPIDTDLTRVRETLKQVDSAGIRFQVGFNRRFDPNFAKAKESIAAGKIGTPHILRITSRDPAPPPHEYIRVSGGLFLDMTIHDFDMTRFLSGSEADEIYALGAVLVDPAIGKLGDIDSAIITMKLKNGMLASIDNSRQAVYGYDQRIEIFGSAGMVQVANRTPDSQIYSNADNVQTSKPLYFFLERYKESFTAEMRAFVDCIRNNTQPRVTGNDGLMPLIMALAAKKSLVENRPVKLDEVCAADDGCT
ncbi:MAG: inositol 2-dehydrogenase [Verrucomicrobia bacterium]|nr:inositol 2-dehydrogenase [Verrucomicrobiota bacterium]